MSKLAILMTVHNRKSKTLDCLRNIYSQLPILNWDIDIYLTDDGCTDGTTEAIRTLYPDVIIISGDGNLFWNQGMRKAWAAASSNFDYDAYLWLNDDTMLFSDALYNMIKSYSDFPHSIITGTTMSLDGSRSTYGGLDKSGKVLDPDSTLQSCNTFNGNVVLIPNNVFKRIGNLDRHYSHSLGDIDYGFSAKKQGIELLVAPYYVGKCDRNLLLPKWMRPEIPLKERISNLFSPLGYTNPKEYYYFKKKHWNSFIAILAMLSIFLHFISPSLWKKIRH